MKIADFRSDTVTQPTQEMRDCLLEVELGDDVYGQDPTVAQLEKEVAMLVGKEEAMLCPSGVFANLCAVLTYRPYHREVILSASSHIMENENGNLAAIGHCLTHTIPEVDGFMPLEAIRQAIKTKRTLHSISTELLYLECPTFLGRVPSLDYLGEAYRMAKQHKLKVHMDGARLFNAAAYLKVHPKELARFCDSVMTCLSKGLCAPVGSIIAGSKEFIGEARYVRKMMGGGMRQAGVIAGPALFSVRKMWIRVGEDNERALKLGRRLLELGLEVRNTDINIIYMRVPKGMDPDQLREQALA